MEWIYPQGSLPIVRVRSLDVFRLNLLAQIVDDLAHLIDRLNVIFELVQLAMAIDLDVERIISISFGGACPHFLKHCPLDSELLDLKELFSV